MNRNIESELKKKLYSDLGVLVDLVKVIIENYQDDLIVILVILRCLESLYKEFREGLF